MASTHPLMSWGKPITAASATEWCATNALSISALPSRCPLTLMTSGEATHGMSRDGRVRTHYDRQ